MSFTLLSVMTSPFSSSSFKGSFPAKDWSRSSASRMAATRFTRLTCSAEPRSSTVSGVPA